MNTASISAQYTIRDIERLIPTLSKNLRVYKDIVKQGEADWDHVQILKYMHSALKEMLFLNED